MADDDTRAHGAQQRDDCARGTDSNTDQTPILFEACVTEHACIRVKTYTRRPWALPLGAAAVFVGICAASDPKAFAKLVAKALK